MVVVSASVLLYLFICGSTSPNIQQLVCMIEYDWNFLRTFVAVADAGSLSAAARALGVSQPTLGRHIAQLEEHIGASLFARHPRGLRLTERGAELYEPASVVRGSVELFQRRAAGLDQSIEGAVRISASEIVALYVLPALLVPLRRDYPGLEFEIIADNTISNLLGREADIAVRMLRPTQRALIARKVADATLGLYASPLFVQNQGAPASLADLGEVGGIGMDRDDIHLRTLQRLGWKLHRRDFAVRTDFQPFHVEAARAGLGVAGVQCAIARQLGDLVRVLPELTLPPLPVWVVAHADVRRAARVRTVFDAIAGGLTAFYAPIEALG